VSADETGVTITQTIGNDNITHKKINWEDFTNVATGEPYPFADWGLSDGGNPQTFSSKATYKYSDDTTTDMETAISFTLVFIWLAQELTPVYNVSKFAFTSLALA
jgi:hypothetical protein